MNVLVGGTGFIGTALAEKLIQQGEAVTSIARNIPEQKTEGVVYRAIDIFAHPEQLIPLFGHRATIFLLIGQNSSTFDASQELEGFEKVLDVIRTSVPEKVLFTSTALVYGESIEAAKEHHILAPKDIYAQFKVSCEKKIQEKLADIPVAIVRLGNVYGSEKNKGFIGLVLRKAIEGAEIRVNGDGLQERDYIFLDEVVSAMLTVKGKLKESDTVNIVTGRSETLLEVLKVVSEVIGRPASFFVTGIPVAEAGVVRVDNTKLKEKYGFVPRIFLKEGLEKTWGRYAKE